MLRPQGPAGPACPAPRIPSEAPRTALIRIQTAFVRPKYYTLFLLPNPHDAASLLGLPLKVRVGIRHGRRVVKHLLSYAEHRVGCLARRTFWERGGGDTEEGHGVSFSCGWTVVVVL